MSTTTLSLPAPAPAAAPEVAVVAGQAAAPVVPPDRLAAARTGLRVLAAVGPVDT